MSKVLIVSHERLRSQMSGPSIRNWELAGALAAENEVTLAAPGDPERDSDRFRVSGYAAETLKPLVRAADVVLCSGFLVSDHPVILEAPHLAVDLYGPFELEHLHQRGRQSRQRHAADALGIRRVLRDLLLAGDVFFCASERQRDFWLGWLDAAGRVNPATHDEDPGYSSMLRLLPFGLSSEPPRPGPPRFRNVIPGIGEGDFVVLWGGGIWDWFDPLTLIRAAAATAERLPALRVVFPAGSPSERVPRHAMSATARRLSHELGLTGSRVFFNETWVPYDERGQMYLESDVGVSIHSEDIETRFSFRTRVLEYLWAGLPVIATEGDAMADLVGAHDLGAVVRCRDAESLAAALVDLSEPKRRSACAERVRRVADGFLWSKVAAPLADYCRNPFVAPDRAAARARIEMGAAGGGEVSRLMRRSLQVLRTDGAGAVLGRGREYLRRRGRGR